MLRFTKLNSGWNAEPNAPDLQVEQDETSLFARFRPNLFLYPEFERVSWILVRFGNCERYRITSINDHGWYDGQCRFSGLAPAWGEFYEISGNTRDDLDATPWVAMKGFGTRHFHFYFRDQALEVKAFDWSTRTVSRPLMALSKRQIGPQTRPGSSALAMSGLSIKGGESWVGQRKPRTLRSMVLELLGSGWTPTGGDWSGWDIQHETGLRVEVKQSAKLQSWGESKASPRFSIKAAMGHYPDGVTYVKNQSGERLADYYVFAWHDGSDQRIADQWEFYLVPSSELPFSQKSIGLTELRKITSPLKGGELRASLSCESR